MSWFRGARQKSHDEQEFERAAHGVRLYLSILHDQPARNYWKEAESNASYMVQYGDEGLRLGSPYSIHAKLKYWRGQFSLTKGDASDESAQVWENKVGEKFKAAGLPFGYLYQKPPT